MIPRDRFIAAVNREEIDRFPIDVGGVVSNVATIAYERFLKAYYPSLLPATTCNQVQQLACMDEKILQEWKSDTRHVGPFFESKSEQKDSFIDAFGIKFIRVSSPQYDPLYYEMVKHPLEGSSSVKDIENFPWPTYNKKQLEETTSEAKRYHYEGYAVVVDPAVGGMLEQPAYMCGLEKYLLDIHDNPDFSEKLVESCTTFLCDFWEEWLAEAGEWATVVMLGDDYGMQDRMLISPVTWRKLVKRRLERVVKVIKKAADVKIMIHSCGSVYPVIQDIIDVGIDILNPVQPKAKDMDHGRLKEKFGDQVCFHGGIDIQDVLPRGSPSDVKEEVERVFGSLGKDGTGYIFSTAHNIQADVSPENIKALFDWI
ncbi:MAG: uroporphyrinogen decarboxylase family protein [Candidatus Hodarchaeales archaeon]|jgi:uroporphyrinogen decarboxylase